MTTRSRIKVLAKDGPPVPPQWRGRTGCITEDRPGGFHLGFGLPPSERI